MTQPIKHPRTYTPFDVQRFLLSCCTTFLKDGIRHFKHIVGGRLIRSVKPEGTTNEYYIIKLKGDRLLQPYMIAIRECPPERSRIDSVMRYDYSLENCESFLENLA